MTVADARTGHRRGDGGAGRHQCDDARPLPYPDADRLVRLSTQPPGTTELRQRNPLSVRTVHSLSRRRRCGWRMRSKGSGRAIGRSAATAIPKAFPAALVSPGALPLLGCARCSAAPGPKTKTARTRGWSSSATACGSGVSAPTEAVLGRTVLVDREPHVVIGVMPAGFQAIYIESELWTPLNAVGQGIETTSTFIQTVARLRPGATIEQLRAEMAPAMDARDRRIAEDARRDGPPRVDGMRDAAIRGSSGPRCWCCWPPSSRWRCIAAANLANLTLAQVMSRRGEIALRAALGAGRAGVLRLQLVESLMLSARRGTAGWRPSAR